MGSNLIKDLVFDRYLPGVYRHACKKDIIKGRVLFVEYRTACVPDSFRLILSVLRKDPAFECRFVALDRNHSSYPEFIRKSTLLVREMAAAEVVFLSDINEVVSCVEKRPGTKVVQLWHACGAFKKFGYSTIGNEHGTDADWIARHPLYGNLDMVTVSAPAVTDHFAEAMHLEDRKEVIRSTGVSRSDIFFKESVIRKAREKLEEVFPAARSRKVILYAPTFRGRTPHVTTAPDFDAAKLLSRLGDEYALVIKHHPLVKEREPLPEGDYLRNVFVSEGECTIEQLLCACDMVITDYSSLIFEYSLLERPMFFFAPDLEEYEKWNGFYEPYEQMVPGPVCRTMDELAGALCAFPAHYDASKAARFKETWMGSCDGHATMRILSELFPEKYTDC